MKNTLLSGMLFFSIITVEVVIGQNDSIKEHHYIDSSIDRFTKNISIYGKNKIYQKNKIEGEFKLFEMASNGRLGLTFTIISGPIVCIDEKDTKVLFLFEDGNTKTMPYNGVYNCDGRITLAWWYEKKKNCYLDIPKEIAKTKIKSIRFISNNHIMDFDVNNENSDIISNTTKELLPFTNFYNIK